MPDMKTYLRLLVMTFMPALPAFTLMHAMAGYTQPVPEPEAPATELQEESPPLVPQEDTAMDATVSSGNLPAGTVPAYDAALLQSINDGIALLAAAESTSVYLSADIVDVFDRVIQGYGGDVYYIAYSNGTDAYTGVMYVAPELEVDGTTYTLTGGIRRIEYYRTQVGSAYSYRFRNVDFLDTASESWTIEESVTNVMYYTNFVPGYPVLGASGASPDPAVKHLLTALFAFQLFAWCFQRVKNAVRGFTGRRKDDG